MFSESTVATSDRDPKLIFKNTFPLSGVVQHCEKLKIEEAVHVELKFDGALENPTHVPVRGVV